MQTHDISTNRACQVVNLPRSQWYYLPVRNDSEVIEKLEELAERYPTRGFDTYYGKIRSEGLRWNRKRVLRVYRKMNLKMRRKRKRRLPTRVREPLTVPAQANHTWSADFMSDALARGRRIRILNVIDDYNREALVTEPAYSLPAERVVEQLEQLIEWRGKPRQIRTDNGPEFLSETFQSFCSKHGIAIRYIQPGKPSQNGFIERFNRTFREDVLDAYLFDDISQVRILANTWREDYNNNHPHSALGGQSPLKFINQSSGSRPARLNQSNKEDLYNFNLS